MKKMILTLALMCGCGLGTQAQLLFKIIPCEKAGNDSSKVSASYIIASNSMMNPLGIVSQINGLKNIMTETDQLYLEVNKTAYKNSINEAKKLDNNQKLLSLLTPAQQAKLNAFLKKYMEVDFKSPYIQKKYGNITPAALLEELKTLLFVASHMGEYDPSHTFDEYFEAQAKVNNETIGALTSPDDYINAKYKSDLKEQTKKLVTFLENETQELSKLNKSVDAFHAKDVNAAALATGATVDKKTLNSWTDGMIDAMAKKSTLFVIDAANLGGNEGIIQLLHAKEYNIESVDEK